MRLPMGTLCPLDWALIDSKRGSDRMFGNLIRAATEVATLPVKVIAAVADEVAEAVEDAADEATGGK